MGGAQLGASLAACSGSRRGGAPKSDLPPPAAAAAVCPGGAQHGGGKSSPEASRTEVVPEREERSVKTATHTHTLEHV